MENFTKKERCILYLLIIIGIFIAMKLHVMTTQNRYEVFIPASVRGLLLIHDKFNNTICYTVLTTDVPYQKLSIPDEMEKRELAKSPFTELFEEEQLGF